MQIDLSLAPGAHALSIIRSSCLKVHSPYAFNICIRGAPVLCQMLGVEAGAEINREMGRAMPELNLEGKEEFTKQIKEEWAIQEVPIFSFHKGFLEFLFSFPGPGYRCIVWLLPQKSRKKPNNGEVEVTDRF